MSDLGPFDTRRILGEQAAGGQRVDEIRKVLQENWSPKLEDATWLSRALDTMEARLRAVEAERDSQRKQTEYYQQCIEGLYGWRQLLTESKADAQRLTAEHRAQLAALKVTWEAKEAEVARLREVLNHGFCRKCGESVAPHGGSDPEHRWPY